MMQPRRFQYIALSCSLQRLVHVLLTSLYGSISASITLLEDASLGAIRTSYSSVSTMCPKVAFFTSSMHFPPSAPLNAGISGKIKTGNQRYQHVLVLVFAIYPASRWDVTWPSSRMAILLSISQRSFVKALCTWTFSQSIARLLVRLTILLFGSIPYLFSDGRILDLSEFPRLCSLTIRLYDLKLDLAPISRLLSHSRPCSTFHTLNIELDDILDDIARKTERFSHPEDQALCHEIEQSILGVEKNEGTKAVTLTFKITKTLPTHIAAHIEEDLRSAFPDLDRNGTLKTDFIVTNSESVKWLWEDTYLHIVIMYRKFE